MRHPSFLLFLAAALPLAGQSAAAPASAAASNAASAPAVSSTPAAKSAIPGAGATAPAFTLQDESGTQQSFQAPPGQPVLIAFYPKDFTGG